MQRAAQPMNRAKMAELFGPMKTNCQTKEEKKMIRWTERHDYISIHKYALSTAFALSKGGCSP